MQHEKMRNKIPPQCLLSFKKFLFIFILLCLLTHVYTMCVLCACVDQRVLGPSNWSYSYELPCVW